MQRRVKDETRLTGETLRSVLVAPVVVDAVARVLVREEAVLARAGLSTVRGLCMSGWGGGQASGAYFLLNSHACMQKRR